MKKLMYIIFLILVWKLGMDDNNTLIAVILSIIPILQMLGVAVAVGKSRKKKII